MEILLTLVIFVGIYFLYSFKSEIISKISLLEMRILDLKDLLEQQKARTESSKAPFTDEKIDKLVQKEEPAVEKPLSPEAEKLLLRPESVPQPVLPPEKVILPPQKPALAEEPALSFFERHPDLEKFIGENLVNKIGIAILVLSIAYFVKYAIDSNWIGQTGRVGIGILCGAILVGFAHRMRNTYTAFSSVLLGGGIAVFYFTITLAYHQFHLFNQTAAFIILVIITVFAVLLSLLYDKQELGVIALIGGLASPFMISSGHANYNTLFIYLLILNAGLLVLAYYKSWRILNRAAFALTVILITGILFTIPEGNYFRAFIYTSVFYLLFFAINIAYNIRENKNFISSDFGIILINTALYFSAGLYLLTAMHQEQFRGLFSASLAIVNLGLSYMLFRNRKVDPNVLYLLIGITLTFISLTAPIQLKGSHITLFWASEAVLLYWLYLKSGIKLTKLTSLIIWCCMIISLLIDWTRIYGASNLILPIIANKGFITTIFAAISSYILFMLVKKDETPDLYGRKVMNQVFLVTSVSLCFLAGLFEINQQFSSRYPQDKLDVLYVMLYVPAFVFFLNLLSQKVKTVALNWEIRAGLLALSILIYLLHTSAIFYIQRDILEIGKPGAFHFTAHWISAILIGVLLYLLVKIGQQNLQQKIANPATWILAATIVLFLSLEVSLISNMIFYSKSNPIDQIQTIYIKTGLPVLWGLSSFAMMWLGMKLKVRILRIVSLSLFTITLAKLFLFDIRNIPPAGKIAAFFCLGVLLLSISFMYQKVKHIIIEDESKEEV